MTTEGLGAYTMPSEIVRSTKYLFEAWNTFGAPSSGPGISYVILITWHNLQYTLPVVRSDSFKGFPEEQEPESPGQDFQNPFCKGAQ